MTMPAFGTSDRLEPATLGGNVLRLFRAGLGVPAPPFVADLLGARP